MQEFLSVWVSTQKPQDFLSYPNSHTNKTRPLVLPASGWLKNCSNVLFFLTDQQFPFRVKGDIQGGRRDLDKKKMFYSL